MGAGRVLCGDDDSTGIPLSLPVLQAVPRQRVWNP